MMTFAMTAVLVLALMGIVTLARENIRDAMRYKGEDHPISPEGYGIAAAVPLLQGQCWDLYGVGIVRIVDVTADETVYQNEDASYAFKARAPTRTFRVAARAVPCAVEDAAEFA